MNNRIKNSLLTVYYLLLTVNCSLFMASCADDDLPNMNGMWQLNTIEKADGTVQSLDSVYYSFQKQTLFSYTALFTNELGHEDHWEVYGYIEYPDDNTLYIILDKSYHDQGIIDRLPWKAIEVEYRIISLKSKKMVLGYGDDVYTFTKY